MGTRHLIAVAVDGNYRIAQYGQWDGNPGGQGVDVLAFCRSIVDADARQHFAEKLRATSWATEDEIEAVNAKLRAGASLSRDFPQLSRDTGSDILAMVRDGAPGALLLNKLDFASDSLFCEWAYVIDLDKGTLEAFKGFNQTPLADGERFASLKGEGEYQPVRMIKAYQLDALPSDDDFLLELDPSEDEEVGA